MASSKFIERRELMGARHTPSAPRVTVRCGARSGSGGSIAGHAAVFNATADIGYFDEVIRPGAFRRAIREGQDVRALFNHDPNFVLGRTTAGTLRLKEDAKGLAVEIDPPDTPTIQDLVMTPMRRGDVTGMSFAFMPTRNGERWSTQANGRELREVLDADLFDVSIVTYPAYVQANAGVRSLSNRLPKLDDRAARWRDREYRLLALERQIQRDQARHVDYRLANAMRSFGSSTPEIAKSLGYSEAGILQLLRP